VLAVSVGQYSFAQFDGNPYAGNPQTNFINFALAQNGTQAYAAAGTGAYAQITPNSQLQLAGGFQGATDLASQHLTTYGMEKGKIAYFLTAQWTSTILAGGSYSILYYNQPSVPAQPSASQGVSFSAAQNLNATYGLFLRANYASGSVAPIETSVAFGGIMNNPFGRSRLDQVGVGIAWDKTNLSAVGYPSRGSETIAEIYYRFTIQKALSGRRRRPHRRNEAPGRRRPRIPRPNRATRRAGAPRGSWFRLRSTWRTGQFDRSGRLR